MRYLMVAAIPIVFAACTANTSPGDLGDECVPSSEFPCPKLGSDLPPEIPHECKEAPDGLDRCTFPCGGPPVTEECVAEGGTCVVDPESRDTSYLRYYCWPKRFAP